MMTRAALMAAVTAVAAQIAIPIFPVPFTLQVLAVVLSGSLAALRGARANHLPSRWGHRRAGLRRVQGRAGRVAGTHGRLPPLLPHSRRCRGARSQRREERIAWSGADRQLPLGCVGLAVIYAGAPSGSRL